ncbi:hypothetical protein AB0M28_01275 [Streptomyces sp. NPDC051940]|uniref:hypothetical protein n=1 Tax=Streptomyces sp. NPDC051940 TaxID=3155675 RepID=UPI0034283A1F
MAQVNDGLGARPAPPHARHAVGRGQWAWAVAGLVVVAVVCVIAAENLQDIYKQEKDFVIGSLFSLAGFCFAKAFTRPRGQRALELLRDQGATEHIALTERNIAAAAERLAEYHDLQCREPEFDRNLGLLRVTLDDIDQSRANLVALRRSLDLDPGPVHTLPSEYAHARLLQVRRNVRAALGRRREVALWLDGQRPDGSGWAWDVDLFTVLTQDLHHASRTLDMMLARYVAHPVNGYVVTAMDYLLAAQERARRFAGEDGNGTPGHPAPPEIFRVLRGDIDEAIADLRQVARMLPRELADDDPEPEPAPVPSPAPDPDPAPAPTPAPA